MQANPFTLYDISLILNIDMLVYNIDVETVIYLLQWLYSIVFVVGHLNFYR